MRVIQNIFFVYVRMIILMSMSLVTSSFLLKNLGVNTYGIYSVIFGVVVIFSFLNLSMQATTQRYLSFNLTQQNKLVEIFKISKSLHLIISIIVLFLGETFGLYFVNNFLNFDRDFIITVNILYQFSLFSMITMIVSVPYVSIILVNHKINFYVVVGLIDGILKLLLAFSLTYITSCKLAIYSVMTFFITLTICSLYYLYASQNFSYIKNIGYCFSWSKTKEMIVYSSWNLLGVFAGLGQNMGVNVLLNIYFNAEINSSRALSLQVYNAINTVNSNAQTIYSPTIIKKYMDKEKDLLNYTFLFSKLNFFIVLLILIPLYLYLTPILILWITQIPDCLELFLKIMFIEILIVSLSGPLHSLIQADHNIKWYQSIISGMLLFNLPVGWYLYKLGYHPDAIYFVSCSLSFLALLTRVFIVKKRKLMFIFQYYYNVILPLLLIILIIYILNNSVSNNLFKIFMLEGIVILFAIQTFFSSFRISTLITSFRKSLNHESSNYSI